MPANPPPSSSTASCAAATTTRAGATATSPRTGRPSPLRSPASAPSSLTFAAPSRFRSKLSDLRRALLGASPSQPRPRLWCPFCSTDLVDLDRPAACSNAIYHLGSDEHMKGVKDFLRKHGGGMDQVDSLRIFEDELAKWEKGCQSLSTGAKKGSEVLIGPSLAPFKDIRNESTSDNLDSFAQTNISSFSHTASYVVMPLQSPTNGAYHPISTACHGASRSGSVYYPFPHGTVGLLVTPCGSTATYEQHGMLTTNFFHSTDPEIKVMDLLSSQMDQTHQFLVLYIGVFHLHKRKGKLRKCCWKQDLAP